ncbi:MAG: hypothetical protein IT366_19330 [Candidatus Hydrogenedentes bacterium]|nr:hypothetical protein [Candidatus Hydrogenedentota bacterium]
MDRLRQKHDLYIKLGALFGPLLSMVKNLGAYDEQEKAQVHARYCAEFRKLSDEFLNFAKGEKDHDYLLQTQLFQVALNQMAYETIEKVSTEAVILKYMNSARSAIDMIPVPRTSVILEAGSPFTAYTKLVALCETDALTTLRWLDPYFDSSIFHRYLSNVRANAAITLVTCEPIASCSTRDKIRWKQFLAVSELFASERGPELYRLVLNTSLHDRWIVFDEKRIYALGGSAKDAADKKYFTISSVEASQANLQTIKTLVENGTELFGPTNSNHPTVLP